MEKFLSREQRIGIIISTKVINNNIVCLHKNINVHCGVVCLYACVCVSEREGDEIMNEFDMASETQTPNR